jgi:outer membrane murein-binding lipoprotein Lpp
MKKIILGLLACGSLALLAGCADQQKTTTTSQQTTWHATDK